MIAVFTNIVKQMMCFSKKWYYKGISLFIKMGILIVSLVYIIQKISSGSLIEYFYNDQLRWNFFFVALLMVFINWGIEAYKWQFLIQRVERLSFDKALQSVLVGVTIGVFTPNRVGEFTGRVFYLNSENKIQATLISFVGSAFQLLVTLIIGFSAFFFIAIANEQAKFVLFELFGSIYFLTGVILLIISILVFLVFKKWILKKYASYVVVLLSYSFKELLTIFFLSFFRYIIFTVQYYLVLKCFNIQLGFFLTCTLIALTFLVSSIIPTFAFTEITVRGASAIYFFSLYVPDVSLVLASSMVVWLINLALPSLIGVFFIWKLKFFKN